jgi:DNA-binding MarR family transcriptional regulator
MAQPTAESLADFLLARRKIDKQLEAATGLSAHALLVLLVLHSRHPASVKELTRHLEVSGSRTSKLLAYLEKRDCITRRLSPADHRTEDVFLTPHGEYVITRALTLTTQPPALAAAGRTDSSGWPAGVLGLLLLCMHMIVC